MFLKPTSSYLANGGTIQIPHPLESLHYEVEFAVVIGRKARDVPLSTAMDHVGGNYLSNVPTGGLFDDDPRESVFDSIVLNRKRSFSLVQ